MVKTSLRCRGGSMVVAAGLLFWAGCDATDNEQAAANVTNVPPSNAPAEPAPGQPIPGVPGGPPPSREAGPGAPGPGEPGREPGGGRRSPIRNIMVKLDDRRPQGLTKAIKTGLETPQPDWPTIEKQAREYAALATELGTYDPPRGSKESWAKLTAALNTSAVDLEKAAHAKKKENALAVSRRLSGSCMECHREHRRMGGGFGPRGKGAPPPGGAFPPGGRPGGGPSAGEPPPGGPPPVDGPPPGPAA